MRDPVFVGIDLAWNTNAASGFAVVDDAAVLLDSATLLSDDHIIAWMSRPDWRMISRAFGRYNTDAAAQLPSSTHQTRNRDGLRVESEVR